MGRKRQGRWAGAILIFSVMAAAWLLAHNDVPAKARWGMIPHLVGPKRLDAWTIIGPGGGGAFFNPAISPHDPNLVLASTDMTQSFISENGGRTWRQFNLRATCRFTFDPKMPDRIYALANAAGLFRSDDRGHTWSLVFPDPSGVQPVYYDDEAEMYLLPAAGKIQVMTAFAVDPQDSDTLYGIIAGDLRVSRDAGGTWEMLAHSVRGAYLFVDPSSSPGRRRLFTAGPGTTGLWDGVQFTVTSRAENTRRFPALAFGATRDGKSMLYRADEGGIWSSEDGGLNWRSLNEGLLKISSERGYPQFSAIATSREHPEVVYLSFFGLIVAGESERSFGVAKSVDGGVTWTLVRKESNRTARSVHDSWISKRFGPDWGAQPLGTAVDDHNPDLVYTTDLGRILRSTDGGRAWYASYSRSAGNGYTSTGLDVTTSYGIHFAPWNRVFISYTDIGLFVSEDGGASWTSSTTRGVPREWVNTTYWLQFDPQIRNKMWAVMSGTHDLPRVRMFASKPGITAEFRGGVVVSTDGGKSWKPSSRGIPQMAPTHILLDPRSPAAARILYVTGFGRGVYKSIDGGETWTSKNVGLPPLEPLTWRMAMDSNGVLYVVTIRRSRDGSFGNDRDGWLFRSTDGAEHWERMPLPPGVNGPMGITVDPQDPMRLYLSAWGRYNAETADAAVDGGIFRSIDGGAHWQNVLDGSQRIYDVTVDPRDPNLVYATGFEASAWCSADRGQSWRRIPGFNFKDGHRVIPDPADRSKIYITTFGSSVWHGPAEGDPQSEEDITSPPAVRFQDSLPQSRKHSTHIRK
jgi:photosystem II stability/assembly factor-like uncharacterized protein